MLRKAFEPLKRRTREFGLAFASAQLVHLALVAWLTHIEAAPPLETFVIFGAAVFWTYLLSLFSISRLQQALASWGWWTLRVVVGFNYIAYAFALDFLRHLQFWHFQILGRLPACCCPFYLGATVVACRIRAAHAGPWSAMMNKIAVIGILFLVVLNGVAPGAALVLPKSDGHEMLKMNDAKFKDWLLRWERSILRENSTHYCGDAVGEDLGWGMSPFLRGFYFGYLATGNPLWVDRLIKCADAWIKRAVREPDGYQGWPTVGAAGTNVDDLDSFYADSMLGEAMALAPVVLMAAEIRRSLLLKERFGSKAEDYIRLAEQIFDKWDARGVWRETDNGGGVSVELPFGIDQTAGNWTGEYRSRNAPRVGFSHQDNKGNLIANWLLAMFDATAKPVYRDRAEKWFRVMKSRMKLRGDGTYEIWNYWEPAGVWDYKSNGMPKHWIGVHPRAGYYDIDVEGIVAAYKHGLIFNKEDIHRLIATAITEKRYWTALVPLDNMIQEQF